MHMKKVSIRRGTIISCRGYLSFPSFAKRFFFKLLETIRLTQRKNFPGTQERTKMTLHDGKKKQPIRRIKTSLPAILRNYRPSRPEDHAVWNILLKEYLNVRKLVYICNLEVLLSRRLTALTVTEKGPHRTLIAIQSTGQNTFFEQLLVNVISFNQNVTQGNTRFRSDFPFHIR